MKVKRSLGWVGVCCVTLPAGLLAEGVSESYDQPVASRIALATAAGSIVLGGFYSVRALVLEHKRRRQESEIEDYLDGAIEECEASEEFADIDAMHIFPPEATEDWE